jgi:hypothetical protein
LFGDLIARGIALADGSRRGMAINGIGYDSGGEPGVTMHAHAIWRRLRTANQVHCYGRLNGRDASSVLPMKGQGHAGAHHLLGVYPDTARKDRKASAGG